MKFHSLIESSFKDRRVLVRVDFNVPLDANGNITDDTRIRQSVPTIQYILDAGGTVIIMSHLGRPRGEVIPALSLAPVAKRLAELIDKPVQLAPDCVGETVRKMVSKLQPGEVLMLENLRFHPGEQDPSDHPNFIEDLSRLGDFFVNDAFGTSHRRDASIYILPQKFENRAAGFVVEREVLVLSNLLTQSSPPFTAIIAGSKVSSKIGIIYALLEKIDNLLIGGAMAFTFLRVLGKDVGNSLIDADHLDTAKQILKRCKSQGVSCHLPLDSVIADRLSNDADTRVVDTDEGIPDGFIGADIGPKTIADYKEVIANSQTIFWNGPLGVFELEPFRNGTKKIATMIGESSAISIAGGGDSAAAIKLTKVEKRFTHISTGGGATLEYVEKGTLPALEVLTK